jgi:hypothetical protein
MLATATRTEILACHKDTSFVLRVIEDEILYDAAIGTIAPVTEKIIAKALLIRGFKETSRNDLVCIYVL